MCTTCGCGQGSAKVEGEHEHRHDHHHHAHQHIVDNGDLHSRQIIGGSHVPGLSQKRIIQIEADILSKNNHLAAYNRANLARIGVLALNLVSSPGSGKTTLLARTATDMAATYPISVIEGDQQTSLDADRIRATGARAIQVNTGKGCHLDADMVARAIRQLQPQPGSLLFIENVGNLVCPAAFDLGEAAKVVILSVTEGEDKPLKYPDMFAAARLMVLNKSDLLPHVPFDVDKCINYARRVNPKIEILELSALTGDGLAKWYDWITVQAAQMQVGVCAGTKAGE